MPPKSDPIPAAEAAPEAAAAQEKDPNTGGFESLSALSMNRTVAAPAVRRESVRCFVSRGRTVKHDGKYYGQNRELYLPRDEFERLKRFGSVYEINPLEAVVQAQPTPSEGSDTEDGPGVDKTGQAEESQVIRAGAA